MPYEYRRFVKKPSDYTSGMSEKTKHSESDIEDDSIKSNEIFVYDSYISDHPDCKNIFEDYFKISGLPEEKRDFVKNEIIRTFENKRDFTEKEFKFTIENIIDDFASEYELNQQFSDYSLILNTLIELNRLDSFQLNILLLIQNKKPINKRSTKIKHLTKLLYMECGKNLDILFDYDSCIAKIDSKLNKINSKDLNKILYDELEITNKPEVLKGVIKNKLDSMTHSDYFLDDEIDLEEFSKERFIELFDEISDELNERIAEEIDFEGLEKKYGSWNKDLKKDDNSSTISSQTESSIQPKKPSCIDNNSKDKSNQDSELNFLGLTNNDNSEIKVDLELLKDENIKNNLKVAYDFLGFPDFNENFTSNLKKANLKYGPAYKIMNKITNQITVGDFVEDEFYQEFYNILDFETLNKKEIRIKEEKFIYHALKSRTNLSFDSTIYPNDFIDDNIFDDIEYNLKNLKNFSHVKLNSLLLLKDKKPLLRKVDQIKCIFALGEVKNLHFLIQRISKNKSLDIKFIKENLKDLFPKNLAIFLNDSKETNKDLLYEKAVKAIEMNNNSKSEDYISESRDNIDYNWLAIDIYDLVIKQGHRGKIKDYFKLYYKLRGNNDFEKIENEFFFDEEVHDEILKELISRYSKTEINLTRIKYYLIKLSRLSIFQLNILLLILDKKITSNKEDQIKELFKIIDLDDLDNYIYIIENISLFELDLLRNKFSKYEKKELAKYVSVENSENYSHEELLDKFLETIQKHLNSQADFDSENQKLDFNLLADELYKLKIDELNESKIFVVDYSVDEDVDFSIGNGEDLSVVDSSVDEDVDSSVGDVESDVEVEVSSIEDDKGSFVEDNPIGNDEDSSDDVKSDVEADGPAEPIQEDNSTESETDTLSQSKDSNENPLENIDIDELFNYDDDFNKETIIIKSIFADYDLEDNYKEWVKERLNEINEFLAYPISFDDIENDLPEELIVKDNSSAEIPDNSKLSWEEKQKNNEILIKFAELYQKGLLTEEEYEKKKKELL